MSIGKTTELSSVNTAQLVDGAVTSAKIGAGAVVAASIAAGAVGSAAISAGAINSTHIGANAVVSGDIAAGAVGSAALAAGAVVAAAIAAGAVGTAAISSGAATSGQLLQANGSGGASFSTVTSGGMVLISSTTITSASNISFTSIPTTYKQLILVVEQAHMSTHAASYRINSDSTSSYFFWGLATYMDASLGINGANRSQSTAHTGFGVNASEVAPILRSDAASGTGSNSSSVFTIYNASSSTTIKMCRWQSFGTRAHSYQSPSSVQGWGYWNSTDAVTSITSVANSGTGILSARVYLYGLS